MHLFYFYLFYFSQEFREKADALAQSKAASTSSLPQDSAKDGNESAGVSQNGSKATASHYTERDEDGEEELVVVNTRRIADSATAPTTSSAFSDRKGGASEDDDRKLITAGAPETEVPRAEAKTGPSGSFSSSTAMTIASSSSAKAGPSDRVVSSLSASMGAASLNNASDHASNPSIGKGLSPLKPMGGGLRQALPHHIPKMDSLANKMDDIRKNMGDEVS